MKCPSPWPFPKSHWICSQCNLDCILVPFCHCSTNPFPPLSRRYQIWSEKLHWTEWAKTVIVINVVSCFWPHFKRQGSVGYGSAFFFFFCTIFPDPRLLKSKCIFASSWVCSNADLWKRLFGKIIICFLLSHTPRMLLTGSHIVTPPEHISVVVYWETEGGRVSCDYFPRSLNKSFWLFFFWRTFLRFLRGVQTPQRLRTAGLPQLALHHAPGILATDTKGISKGGSNKRLKTGEKFGKWTEAWRAKTLPHRRPRDRALQ